MSLGNDADKFFAVHHDQRTYVFFNHLRQASSTASGSMVQTFRPFLLKYISYCHIASFAAEVGVKTQSGAAALLARTHYAARVKELPHLASLPSRRTGGYFCSPQHTDSAFLLIS